MKRKIVFMKKFMSFLLICSCLTVLASCSSDKKDGYYNGIEWGGIGR